MARLGRPKTEAAEFKRVPLRLPPEVESIVRAQAALEKRTMNTVLLQLIHMGLMAKQHEQESHAYAPVAP